MPDERNLPDIDNLRTVEEVIAWLREAIYLRGRAEAFGLATSSSGGIASFGKLLHGRI